MPQHRGERVGDGFAFEKASARQHLVQHDAERPDVGPPVDRLAASLLGRHVRRRAEDHSRLRAERHRRRVGDVGRGSRGEGVERLREAEVQNFDLALRVDLHVRWLQVPVDDALLVRDFQCLSNLFPDRKRLVDRNRSRFDPVLQRLALDELEDERLDGGRFLHTVDRRDVRMIQRRENARFALEPGERAPGRRKATPAEL